MVLRVGLTGGIACGKSRVLGGLATRNLSTLDLDRVAREITAPGKEAHQAVVEAFGRRVVNRDGEIDRGALGAIVFRDADARARLNAILHPRIRAVEADWVVAEVRRGARVAVTDAALLVESGVHLRFDRLVVVHCSEKEQLQRLMRRDGIDEAAARARISAQMPIHEKRRFAHFEVDTSGSLDDTDRSTAALGADLERLSAARRPPVAVPEERALGCLVHGPTIGPRGLTPLRILEEITSSGGLEMESIATHLVPGRSGVWYRSARAEEAGPSAAALVAPVVLWALARGVRDEIFLASAAASLARLTHLEAPAVADACLIALVLQAVLLFGTVPEPSREGQRAWHAIAARWGGGAPSGCLDPVFEAAATGSSPAVTRRIAAEAGGDPDLAGMLAGGAAGAAAQDASRPVLEALRRLPC